MNKESFVSEDFFLSFFFLLLARQPYDYVTGYNDFDDEGNLMPPDTPTGFAVEMIDEVCKVRVTVQVEMNASG